MIKYKRIGIFIGHSKLKNGSYTSANGVKNEYLYNKELGTEMNELFDELEQPCDLIICPEGQFTSKEEESNYKLKLANSGKYDLIIELHLNSFNGKAKGAEVLYLSNSGKVVAQRVQNKLKTKFTDRGIKKRDNLYMLTKTNPTSIMPETFFCDNADDCKIADSLGIRGVAKLIVEGICNTTISTNSDTTSNSCNYIVKIITDSLNVRKGPSTSYDVATTVKKGQAYTIVEEKNGWGRLKSGAGYISLNSKYVQKI